MADDLPTLYCRTSRKSGSLNYPEPLAPRPRCIGAERSRTHMQFIHSTPWATSACCGMTFHFTRFTKFTNLFCHETPHVSDSSSVHHQEFIHCTPSNGICHTGSEQDQDGTAVQSRSCSKAVYKSVCFIV